MPLPNTCPMQHDIAEAIHHLARDAYPSKIPDGLSALGHYRNNQPAVCRALDSMERKGWVKFEKVGRRHIYEVLPRYPGRGR